jgi:2-phospho-L-lactate guanylyltransferase
VTRRDVWALVPVKPFALAKGRLASSYDPGQRAELAAAMLQDVLAALAAAEGFAGIAIATSDPAAGAIGRRFGARIIDDGDVADLNVAIRAAASVLGAEGAGTLLVLPADIPAVTSGDIEALLAAHPPARAASIVPSHDGDGTNALVLSPPTLLAPAFGPGSLAAHDAAARRAGLVPKVTAIARIAQDVDHPADLDAVLPLGAGPATTSLVASWRG